MEPKLKQGFRSWLPWLALVTVWIVWGSTYLGIQVAIETMPPLLMAGFRFIIAGAVMFAIVGRRHATGVHRLTVPQLRSTAIIGTLMLAGGNGGVSFGETTVDSGLAALIVATVPVWMVLINAFATKTRVTASMILALALGTIGVGILVGGPGSTVDTTGAVIVLVASICWATGSVYARRAPLPAHPLVTASLEMLAGGLVLVAAGAVAGEFGRLDVTAISSASLAGFLWLVVAGSMIAFTAYGYANATLPNDTVATYAYVNPVVAVALGALFAQEVLSANLLIGGAVIVGAVVLIVAGRALSRRLRGRAALKDASRQEPERVA
ncbi:EamA family transporter [Phytomonospora sp. NPDC050363]|uniref:EamA family transporter n=1 Tax=Phytomonospora sp. NPDC050363 TaxID=3155642 RepID=UPI0034039E80